MLYFQFVADRNRSGLAACDTPLTLNTGREQVIRGVIFCCQEARHNDIHESIPHDEILCWLHYQLQELAHKKPFLGNVTRLAWSLPLEFNVQQFFLGSNGIFQRHFASEGYLLKNKGLKCDETNLH